MDHEVSVSSASGRGGQDPVFARAARKGIVVADDRPIYEGPPLRDLSLPEKFKVLGSGMRIRHDPYEDLHRVRISQQYLGNLAVDHSVSELSDPQNAAYD